MWLKLNQPTIGEVLARILYPHGYSFKSNLLNNNCVISLVPISNKKNYKQSPIFNYLLLLLLMSNEIVIHFSLDINN